MAVNDYEYLKKEVYALTKIDLNAYKEGQMKRRIDALIAKHKITGYENFVKALKADKALFEADLTLSLTHKIRYDQNGQANVLRDRRCKTCAHCSQIQMDNKYVVKQDIQQTARGKADHRKGCFALITQDVIEHAGCR